MSTIFKELRVCQKKVKYYMVNTEKSAEMCQVWSSATRLREQSGCEVSPCPVHQQDTGRTWTQQQTVEGGQCQHMCVRGSISYHVAPT